MNGIIRNLVPLLLLMTGSVAFGQANGWKIETLAPIASGEDSQGLIPTHRVAINDVGQIVFVRPDGVYVRDPSGIITKRIEEVGVSLTGNSPTFSLNAAVQRTSVGIDNNGVVYAGQNGSVYRQAPGSQTEIILSTPGDLTLPSLTGDVFVTGSGNVFVSVGTFTGSTPGFNILRSTGSTFESIYSGPPESTFLFPVAAQGDSVVLQSFPITDVTKVNRSYVGQFGRLDGTTYTDLSSLRLLGAYSLFAGGNSIALSSTDAIAYVQGATPEVPRIELTKVVGTGTTTFTFFGQSTGSVPTVSINGSGQIAYLAGGLSTNEGIFHGADSAIDSILLRHNTIEGGARQVENLTVHDVADSGEVILSYVDSLGDSYLARAIPLPSLVNLVNPSFVDGLNGWQTEGQVLTSTISFGSTSVIAIGPDSSLFQSIDLPNVPFQIELIIPPLYATILPSPEAFLGNQQLTPEPFAFGDPIRRFIVTDPSLLGRSNVTFRIAATNSPTIIDGIRITAVPEVSGVLLVAGAMGILMIVQCNWRRARG